MDELPVPDYRVMLSTDIEDYSLRTDSQQRVLQTAFIKVVSSAANAAELGFKRWLKQSNGDSIFAVLPHGTSVTGLMDRFVRELDIGLAIYNRRRREEDWTRMRMRLAVHVGPVYLDGPTGWPGQHAVLPGRLRDSEPVRAALAACPGSDLAVIVSSDTYRDYVTQGPGSPRPTEFRTVLAQVKQQEYIAHLFVPGFDVHAIAALAKFDTSGTPGSESTYQQAAARERREPTGTNSQNDQPSNLDELGSARTINAGRHVIGRISQRVSGGGDANFAGGNIHHSAEYSRGRSDER
jgi:class 3 adenylate cyclase